MTTDEQLLQQYARERSESAFAELVARHLDYVYSAALRVVNGDTPLAQDVTQTVFIDLVRQAGSLPRDAVVAGWLHRHTCYTAAKAVRTERRRQTREHTAMEMRALDDNTRPAWEQVAPYLDESLNQLNPADRDALVLRFLRQQDLRAVGAALGISEDAARKRVDRALEKLHVLLKHRGATLSAAALGTALATEAVTAAPAGLAATISSAAILAGSTTTTAVTATKAIAMTTLHKTLITATIIVLAGTGIYEARRAAKARAVQQFEDKASEKLTADNKKLILSVHVGWRISDAKAFSQEFPGGSALAAQRQLENMIRSAEGAVVGRHNLSDFVNSNPSELKLVQIEREMQTAVEKDLTKNHYGASIESLRISTLRTK